jgi:hypothetical protein
MRKSQLMPCSSSLWRIPEHQASSADRQAVLSAYQERMYAGNSTVKCYIAAVNAWCKRHPDHSREYAGRAATAVVLEARAPRIMSMNEEL